MTDDEINNIRDILESIDEELAELFAPGAPSTVGNWRAWSLIRSRCALKAMLRGRAPTTQPTRPAP